MTNALSEQRTECSCLRCTTERTPTFEAARGIRMPIEGSRMFVCETCGCKRCPRSDDHRNACTNSNEPGQQGSRY